jgi:hypothetical protein
MWSSRSRGRAARRANRRYVSRQAEEPAERRRGRAPRLAGPSGHRNLGHVDGTASSQIPARRHLDSPIFVAA